MVSSKDFFPGWVRTSSSLWKPHIVHKLREVHAPGKTRNYKKLLCTEWLERMQQHSLKLSQKRKLCKPLRLVKDLLLETGNTIKTAFSNKERCAQVQTFTCCKAISSCSILWHKRHIFVCCYLLHHGLTQQAAPHNHSLTHCSVKWERESKK